MRTSDGHVYLLTDDVRHLLAGWARTREFTLPSRGFFTGIAGRLQDAIAEAIGDIAKVQVVEVETLIDHARTLLQQHARGLPVICMDRALADAVPEDDRLSYESSRIVEFRDGAWKMIGHGPRPGCLPLEEQIARIVVGRHPAQLNAAILDDVCYDGDSLRDCAIRFHAAGMREQCAIVGIRRERDPNLDLGFPIHPLLRYPSGRLYEAVDMRDFIFGCPEGGRVVAGQNGHRSAPGMHEYGVPYLHGFGDTDAWASIPTSATAFTNVALAAAVDIYREIGARSGRSVRMRDIGRWPYLANGRPFPCDPNAVVTEVIAHFRDALGRPAVGRDVARV